MDTCKMESLDGNYELFPKLYIALYDFRKN